MTLTPAALRQQFATDFQRPTYHFLPPSNWMNDPNGFIQWQGQYHLFYQYNPFGATWGNMHWGHAVSRDLIHWEDLPIALAPTPGGPDETGCFSGCAVDNNGVPTVIYTGARGEKYDLQTQCVATSHDNLLTWEKYPGNPVLSEVPAIAGQQENFRDPFVWREGDSWYMVLASEIRGQGGVIFLYRSADLLSWDYLHPLQTGELHRDGYVWECPNFFPIGDKWVLIVSAHTGSATGTVFYFVGDYHDHHFTPIREGVLDYATLYAPLTTLDSAGRRLLFGWLRESRGDAEMRRAGWSGAQSIPRVLTLDDQNRLLMTPVAELGNQRRAHHRWEAVTLNGEIDPGVKGWALDIQSVCQLQAAGVVNIGLACSADGHERTDVIYEAATQQLIVRTTTYATGDIKTTASREITHALDAGEPLRLRLLLDGSVLEIIANDRTSLSHRLYPKDASCDGLRLAGSNATLQTLDIWEMASIWG